MSIGQRIGRFCHLPLHFALTRPVRFFDYLHTFFVSNGRSLFVNRERLAFVFGGLSTLEMWVVSGPGRKCIVGVAGLGGHGLCSTR